jgi:hypothetical protein
VNGPGTLSLPDHGVKTKHGAAGDRVFDPIRRRWVALTPEEWVRQHFLNHLVHDLDCPASLLAVEHSLSLNGLAKRADIVVYGRSGTPIALVECKAPGVRISQETFDQAARYNSVFKVGVLIVTNGHVHYCCTIDHRNGTVTFMDRLPDHTAMQDISAAYL